MTNHRFQDISVETNRGSLRIEIFKDGDGYSYFIEDHTAPGIPLLFPSKFRRKDSFENAKEAFEDSCIALKAISSNSINNIACEIKRFSNLHTDSIGELIDIDEENQRLGAS